LTALRREGKIRHIGVSNFGPLQLTEALATGAPIAVNELPYSLLTRTIEREILPLCRARGVGVLGYMALLQGALSDRYVSPRRSARVATAHAPLRQPQNPAPRHGLPGHETETAVAIEAIRVVARRLGMSTSELALKWAVAGEGITSSLCGSRDVASLHANIKAAGESLDAEIVAELKILTDPLLAAMGPSFDYYENPAQDRTR